MSSKSSKYQHPVKGSVEVVKGRLWFVTLSSAPPASCTNDPKFKQDNIPYFMTVDHSPYFKYEPFFDDFGPLNMGMLYDFCMLIQSKLNDPELSDIPIYVYTALDSRQRSNLVYLLGGYMVMMQNSKPDEAVSPFISLVPPLLSFRDASYGLSTYNLAIRDVLAGLYRAKQLNIIDFCAFDVHTYKKFDCVENGDLNWIVPKQILAFSGPTGERIDNQNGYYTSTPDDYVPLFKSMHVTGIVRLNKKMYDRRRFTNQGFRHYDLYFVDGGCPSEEILDQFLKICTDEIVNNKGAIAVHCKAGLGRTGCLIACFLMYYYGFTAAEAIGYIRVCRPGSIIGYQQHFVIQHQDALWDRGMKIRREQDIPHRTVAPPTPRQYDLTAAKITDDLPRTPRDQPKITDETTPVRTKPAETCRHTDDISPMKLTRGIDVRLEEQTPVRKTQGDEEGSPLPELARHVDKHSVDDLGKTKPPLYVGSPAAAFVEEPRAVGALSPEPKYLTLSRRYPKVQNSHTLKNGYIHTTPEHTRKHTSSNAAQIPMIMDKVKNNTLPVPETKTIPPSIKAKSLPMALRNTPDRLTPKTALAVSSRPESRVPTPYLTPTVTLDESHTVAKKLEYEDVDPRRSTPRSKDDDSAKRSPKPVSKAYTKTL